MTQASEKPLQDNLAAKDTWVRGLLMVLFYAIYKVAELLLIVVAIFQFVAALVTGRPSEALTGFGASLSRLFYDIMQFLTWNTDERPFPFGPWPAAQPPAKRTRRAAKA